MTRRSQPPKPPRAVPPPPPPTAAELRILGVLWRRGPSTVREVNDALAAEKAAGYTTTLKFLQIMHEKRLVSRDESARNHVYAAAVAEADMQRQAARDLLSRVFGGSAASLVQHALSAQPASREELRKIRDLLGRLERDQETNDG
jgi:predicted transcriptional regulator